MICASCLSPASLVCVTSEYLLPYPILTWQLLQDSGSEDEGEDGDAEDGSYDQSNGEGEGVGVSDLFDALSEISMNTEEFLEKEEGDFIHTTYLPFPSILYLPFSTFPSLLFPFLPSLPISASNFSSRFISIWHIPHRITSPAEAFNLICTT